MMNRLRTAFVSVTAVAVSMIVLGSDARAKSVPTASQQNYLRLLERLAEGEIKNGTSLMQRYSSLEMTINRLENIPHPRPRLAREIAAEIATDFKQESRVVASLQNNTNALLATQADLQALPPQEKAQVSNLLNSIQRLVVEERGAATPVRAASWTAQVLLHTSTAALATRDPKDSEVRNRRTQGARHTPRAARRSLIAEPGNN